MLWYGNTRCDASGAFFGSSRIVWILRNKRGDDMADQLQVGLTCEKSITVDESHAARHLAGKGIRVLSTPEMVRLMEECALEGVLPFLQPNQNTVGTRVEMRHLAATPMGMKVTARCTL